MPTYKLVYFDLRGRAEVIRLLFAAAGVPYEDYRVERSRWSELKPSTPFGQIPVLEVDGVRLCQSKAIARYLAGEFGFVPETALDKARTDMIVDCVDDVLTRSLKFFHEKDKTRQAELQEIFIKEYLPTSLKSLEKLLVGNNGGDSYFVGDKMTWADIAFADLCTWLAGLQVEVSFDDIPKLKALKERVESTPKIAEWIKNRPVTQI